MTEPFLGQLMYVSFNFAPKGWATASGQVLPINQNQALFSLLGTTYGGNGTTNFQLPDMRGRVPIHQGQGPGLPTYTIGEQTGTQAQTLLASQMPAHTHGLFVSTNNATAQEPVAGVMLAHAVSDGGTMQPDIYRPASGATLVAMDSSSINTAGGSQPFTVIQPYLTITCNMALQGIFPSRN